MGGLKKTEGNRPHRRRYRLNKKKFATVILLMGCIAAFVGIAVTSLENADAENAVFVLLDDMAYSVIETTNEIEDSDALEGRVIVVDAGHGGFDPGAIGVSGTYESEINLAVAQLLEAMLEDSGAEVIMTREDSDALAESKDEDMAVRRTIIEESGADIVISIHMNSYEDDSSVCGPVVVFMPGSEPGKELATKVQESLNAVANASGCARAERLYILKSGNMPCILVECGYISNAEEEKKLRQDDYQREVAWAICEGVEAYFSQTEESI